ncbi:hypothetical protein MNBD_GAMMA04-445, partial [hydrothermal vent metagenome]
FALFTISQAADAKRFGGGKSFGYSKSVPSKSFDKSKKAPQAAPKAAPAAAGAKSRSGMMGVLGGLAAGGLLAAMFMGDGFEGLQIMDILLFALLAFVLFKLFRHFTGRSRTDNAPQPAYQANHEAVNDQPAQPQNEQIVSRETHHSEQESHPKSGESIFGSNLGGAVSEKAEHVNEAPTWFNAEPFVEGAKGHFVTLQKAWDSADLSEVESYCSPELFEAIKQEMKGMQAGDNHTVVDTLDAEIADMSIDGDYFIVSIRFTGFIKEAASEDAHAFNEIWHIRRLANDEGTWQVSGIQQHS